MTIGWIYRILALAFGIFGLKSFVGSLMSILTGTSHYALNEELISLSIFGLIPLSISVFLFNVANYHINVKEKNRRERKIIALSRTKKNQVTVLEVAEHLNISFEKANDVLELLHEKGMARLKLTKSGGIIYNFDHLYLSEEEKNEAENLDE